MIQNSWVRSQAFNFDQFPLPLSDSQSESQEIVNEIWQRFYRMHQAGYIAEVLNIQEYICPYVERIHDDCPDNLVNQIIANYTQEEEEEEGEDSVEPELPVTHEEALHALHTLRRYEEENIGNADFLRQLRRHEREISIRSHELRKQVTLDHWFIGTGGVGS